MHQTKDDELNSYPLPFSSLLPERMVAEITSKELGETEEKVREGIAEMKRFIRENNIPTYQNEDFLLKFLRTKKFRLSDSTSMLEHFTKSLKELHNKIGPIDTEATAQVKKCFQKNVQGILPYRDRNGRPTIFYRFGIYYNEGVEVINLTKSSLTLDSILMQEPNSQIVGVNWIVDCKKIALRDVYESFDMGMVFCRFLLRLPIRIKRIDIVNEGFLYRIIYNTFKPFYTKKFRERIHFHGDNFEKLVEFYGSSMLPDELGGTGGEFSNDHWVEEIDKAIEMFNKLQERAMR